MRPNVLFYGTVLFAILLIVPLVSAGECCYGSVQAWFQKSNGQWKNATAHPILRPGEVFQIKIRVSLTTLCRVFFLKLHEFGTPVYEVLTGPTGFEQLLEYRVRIQSHQYYDYQWTVRVRPTTTWTSGTAPLEVFAQLNRNDSEECRIDFDVLVASILPGVPTGSEDQRVSENHPSDTDHGWYPVSFQWYAAFMILIVCGMLIYSMQRGYRIK